jgi:hypothetical protein
VIPRDCTHARPPLPGAPPVRTGPGDDDDDDETPIGDPDDDEGGDDEEEDDDDEDTLWAGQRSAPLQGLTPVG